MSIKKLKNGKYRVDLTRQVNGVRERPRRAFDTLEQAKQFTAKFTLKRTSSKIGFSRRSIDEFIDNYKSTRQYKKLSDASKLRYRPFLNNFKDWCSEKRIEYINDFGVKAAEAYDEHLSLHFKNRGYRSALSFVKMLFSLETVRQDSPLVKNPFAAIDLPEIEDSDIRFLTEKELLALFECSNEEFQRPAFRILYYTGMRTKEFRYLEPSSISFERMTITLRSTEKSKLKTKRSRRIIPIHPDVVPDLKYFYDKHKDEPFLIMGYREVPDNKLLKNYRHVEKRVLRTYGIDLSDSSVHSLRKTCGSHMIQRGVNITYVSKFLGHTSVAVTEKHYADLLIENVIEAVSVLGTDNGTDTIQKAAA